VRIGRREGLPKTSVINCDAIVTLPKRSLKGTHRTTLRPQARPARRRTQVRPRTGLILPHH
jgi:mRNA-degrading endonuclease toxin of MazEF toxin-antitoxin module